MNKMQMYHTIKKYIYALELEDLQVFSKQYLSILKEKYSNNKKTDPYTIIAIDFNKLNDINNLHGREKGDNIIHDILEIMIKTLPKESECIRIGGDEFLIIVPKEKKEVKEYEKKFQEQIQIEREKLLGGTVTTSIVEYKNFEDLSQMLKKAQNNITQKKKLNREKQNKSNRDKKWKKLEYYISNSFDTLFKSLRLHKDYLTLEELKRIYEYVIQAILNGDEVEVQKQEKSENIVSDERREKTNTLTQLIKKEKITQEDINQLSEEDYEKYLDTMVREENTGKMSKAYLYRHLLEKGNEYQALYISMGQVKLSNSKSDYETTNKGIRSKIRILKERVREFAKKIDKNIEFLDKTFSNETKNLTIDFGGGDILLLIDKEVSAEKIFQEVREYLKDEREKGFEENVLKLIPSKISRTINKHNVKQAIEEMRETTLEEKDKMIHDLITQKEVMNSIINIIFRNVLSLYRKEIKNHHTIQETQEFINVMAEKGLEEVSRFNDTQRDFIEKNKQRKEKKQEER